jgi:hypothetical protein
MDQALSVRDDPDLQFPVLIYLKSYTLQLHYQEIQNNELNLPFRLRQLLLEFLFDQEYNQLPYQV